MPQPTVILGRTGDRLLASILSESLLRGIGATVVADGVEEQDLARRAAEERADLVVLGIADWELPSICNRVLDAAPRTVVVGLHSALREPADGRDVRIFVVYSGEADPSQFVDTVITALQRSLETIAVERVERRPS